MRALITGITGFAGGHLAQILLDRDDEVFGVARDDGYGLEHLSEPVPVVITDLRNPTAVNHLLKDVQPDAIYHLAGQAFVPTAWGDPWATLENNIKPQLHIIQAMVEQQSNARLLVVASNEVYGLVREDQLPVKEDTPLRPRGNRRSLIEDVDHRKAVLHPHAHEEPRHQRKVKRHLTGFPIPEIFHSIFRPLVRLCKEHSVLELSVDMRS